MPAGVWVGAVRVAPGGGGGGASRLVLVGHPLLVPHLYLPPLAGPMVGGPSSVFPSSRPPLCLRVGGCGGGGE